MRKVTTRSPDSVSGPMLSPRLLRTRTARSVGGSCGAPGRRAGQASPSAAHTGAPQCRAPRLPGRVHVVALGQKLHHGQRAFDEMHGCARELVTVAEFGDSASRAECSNKPAEHSASRADFSMTAPRLMSHPTCLPNALQRGPTTAANLAVARHRSRVPRVQETFPARRRNTEQPGIQGVRVRSCEDSGRKGVLDGPRHRSARCTGRIPPPGETHCGQREVGR
jgi:hypothetical protein